MQENRKVAKAALIMTSAMVLCRIVSVGKETYVAWFFGAGPVVDAYALAIIIPALGVALFVPALRSSFLALYPTYDSGTSPDRDTFGNLFLSSLLVVSIVLAALLSPIVWPSVKLIPTKSPEVSSHLANLAVPAVWLIVPTAMVTGLITLLNTRHQFSVPQLTHVCPTACIVLFIVAWGRRMGPLAMVCGLFAGLLLQSLVLWVMLVRSGHQSRLRLRGYPDALRRIWQLGLPFILLELLVQFNYYVNRAMASTLEPGRVTVLHWGALLKDVVSGTLVASFLTVLLPHFSEQVAAKATGELRRSCSLVLRYGALVFLPISVLIATCVPPVLQHVRVGRLEPEASYSIAVCFAAYGAGLFGEFTALGLYQALVSLKKVRLMVFIGVFCNFVPNILLNLLLIGPLGVAGLALSSALVSYICLAAVYWTLRNLIGVDNEKRNLVFVAGCVASAAAMGGIVLAVLQGVRMIGGEGLWSDLLGTTAGGIGGLFAYGALLLWRSEDARLVWRICRDKVKNMLGFSPDQSEGNQGS